MWCPLYLTKITRTNAFSPLRLLPIFLLFFFPFLFCFWQPPLPLSYTPSSCFSKWTQAWVHILGKSTLSCKVNSAMIFSLMPSVTSQSKMSTVFMHFSHCLISLGLPCPIVNYITLSPPLVKFKFCHAWQSHRSESDGKRLNDLT